MKKTISGIRGIFGDDLHIPDVLEYCGNFAAIAGGACILGRDTRPSGEIVKGAACAALMAGGADVYDLGIAPTPAIFREARRIGAGVAVTSSHNPLEWNGLKFALKGRGITEDELRRILVRQDAGPKIGRYCKIKSVYVEEAAHVIGADESSSNVVMDLGGGAARGFAPELMRKIGCGVTVINENGSSRGPDPTSDDLSDLSSATVGGGIGFAFDLDGDRLVVVKDGVRMSPDATLGLGAAGGLSRGCKKFVLSADTSLAVREIVVAGGGTALASKVGEANVSEVMRNSGADAGGEGSSGGFIMQGFNHCRDGILASGLIASMLGSQAFDDAMEMMGRYSQVRVKVPADSETHEHIMDRLADGAHGRYSHIQMLDGIKGIIDECSWVLVRPSNTEDAIRVSAESDSADRCDMIVKDTIAWVEDARNAG